MGKIAIAVHGGASEDSAFLRTHRQECKQGLAEAVEQGYGILNAGGTAIDAVQAAVQILEDNPLFNAGKGAALNSNGEVEMDASIMEGKTLRAGAVSMVRTVQNPVLLARLVMEHTRHVYLSGYGATELAKKFALPLQPESYFITPHQWEEFQELHSRETENDIYQKRMKGTVGAVALDQTGNLAAATSTGGLNNCLPGRVGDSCIIGAGCYANQYCAVSGTGEGEYLIRQVVGHTIAMMVENKLSLQNACEEVIFQRNKLKGEMGVISVDQQGNFGVAFNSEIMKRAFKASEVELIVEID
ncbi:MAG: isoaspartyl peptidase/L-asparaginase [Legionella sp. 40-6]|nr:isoaspartyl peptidase/L-asparaginase [Legionella sp.]OJY42445.1 MAG: isoaspartyl peptidase/L-asparaginase [Legionella sp. 40-6]